MVTEDSLSSHGKVVVISKPTMSFAEDVSEVSLPTQSVAEIDQRLNRESTFMRVRKIIVWSIAIVIFSVAGFIGFSWYDAWHRYAVEDEIHFTFSPLASALYRFEEQQGTPASNVAELVPEYIPAIPTSRLVSTLEYELLDDGKEWQLSLHSRALKHPRVYCCRSTQHYDADEQRRILGKYHSYWTVLSE